MTIVDVKRYLYDKNLYDFDGKAKFVEKVTNETQIPIEEILFWVILLMMLIGRKWYMKIYTLNINGLRGSKKGFNKKVALTELKSNLKNLKEFIDKIIIDPSDIIILQEVPHKLRNGKTKNSEWIENPMHQEFIDAFSNTYRILKPKYLIDSYQCTIALCRKSDGKPLWDSTKESIVSYNSDFDYGNKIVEICYKDRITLLGLHINPCEDMWEMLLNSCKSKARPNFLIGDFNADESKGDMRNKPIQLRDLSYNSLIPNNVITYYKSKTSVDNIYVNSNYKFKNSLSIIVRKTDAFQTDHALCGIELKLY